MASKGWVRFNEDARASYHRAKHVEEHGGEFIYRGKSRGWHWNGGNAPEPAPVVKEAPKPPIASTSKKKKTTKK